MLRRYCAFIWIYLSTMLLLFGGELVNFSTSQLRISGAKTPETEAIKITKNRVAWGEKLPSAIFLALPDNAAKIEGFEKAELKLKVTVSKDIPIKRIVLRLRDVNGETFQFAPQQSGTLKSGEQTLTYSIDSAKPVASIWGGNKNKVIDFPARISEIAIDTRSNTPPNSDIVFNSIDIKKAGPDVEFSFVSGHQLNLLLADNSPCPYLKITNNGAEPISFSGTVTLNDVAQELSFKIELAQEHTIPVIGDISKKGIYDVTYELQQVNGKPYKQTHRFGRINPAGPTAGRAEEFLFGMCGHPERFSVEAIELEALATALSGAKILRVDLGWRNIQPSENKWNYAKHDKVIDIFKEKGVEIQGVLAYCGPWAVAKNYVPKNEQYIKRPGNLPDAQLFAIFVKNVVTRYKDRIKYFEIWNEPDLVSFANFSSEKYMELLRKGYDAAKSVDPNVKVLTGGVAHINSKLRVGSIRHNSDLYDMLKADNGKHFDIFAYHGHGSTESYVQSMETLQKEGFIGENIPWGWYSNETGESSYLIGEKEQAILLFQKILVAWANGAIGYNWYLLREKEYYPIGNKERHFGIITADFKPKAGYITYNMLANTYKGGKFLRPISIGNGISAFLFEDAKKQQLLALWNIGKPNSLFLKGVPKGTEYIDMYGNISQIQEEDSVAYLNFTNKPFTLRFPANSSPDITTLGGLIANNIPAQFALPPGQEQEIKITLSNPTSSVLPVNISTSTESTHIRCLNASQNIELAPKSQKSISLKLDILKDFNSTALAPDLVNLEITPQNLSSQLLSLKLAKKNTDANVPMFVMEEGKQYYSLVESTSANEEFYWHGVDDLSAKCFISAKDQNLHLKFIVKDDKHFQKLDGINVYGGDNIQLGFKLPTQTNMWKLGLTLLDDGESQVWCWGRPAGFNGTGTVPSIKLNVQRNEATKQTIYDAIIPFKTIGLTDNILRDGFSFNAIINDNDGVMRKGFIAISSGLGLTEEPDSWPIINLDNNF